MGALAGAIGGARFLRMKRKWLVPSSLWTVTVAPSGSGKSPPLQALTAPHWERDRLLVEATKKAMADYEARLASTKRAGDPEKQKLLKDKEQIEQAIDELKYRKASMAVAEYRQQLSKYLVDLAKTQEALDK